MADPAKYQLIFDGGSKGNPGRGYGSFRTRPEGGKWSEPTRLEYGNKVTNNEAEYRAMIDGLDSLAESLSEPGRARVTVLSDSKLVVEQMKGAWRVRAANLAPLNMAARRSAARFAGVRYVWHSRKESVRLLGH